MLAALMADVVREAESGHTIGQGLTDAVGNGDYAGELVDGWPGEGVGITLAIPSFVVR